MLFLNSQNGKSSFIFFLYVLGIEMNDADRCPDTMRIHICSSTSAPYIVLPFSLHEMMGILSSHQCVEELFIIYFIFYY